MKRKSYTEEQIITILKEADAGTPVKELCRKYGMGSASFYAWRKKFGGTEVSEAKRLRALEDENRRLKSMVADQALDIQMLRAINEKGGNARRQTASGGRCFVGTLARSER